MLFATYKTNKKKTMKNLIQTFILILSIGACLQVKGQDNFTITPEGYLSKKGLSVLTYHNKYFVGKQGAIEIIQNDRRIITNGMVKYQLQAINTNLSSPEFFSEPIPKTKPVHPVTNKSNNSISIRFEDEEKDMVYDVMVKGNDTRFTITVNVVELPDDREIKEFSFELELFPGFYRGKSFTFENESGTFPLNFYHPLSKQGNEDYLMPMGTGERLIVAPESPEYKMAIEAKNGTLTLLDTRSATDHNWYTLKATYNLDKIKEDPLVLNFHPNILPNYSKQPVIGYSQVGYHPNQKKEAIIEVDTNYVNDQDFVLFQLNKESGDFIPVLTKKPDYWGKYNRYDIYTFDFSEVTSPGMYYIEADPNNKTEPFVINADFYKQGVWQPALETFLPVQMCHMRIKDRNRIWHGVCHLDDALQAPTPLPFFDGFSQGENTETPYKPYETIPGLNQGGWHDAGDDDVNTNSSGRTVYHLSLIKEEFGVNTDQTTIDFDKREVFLHRPDGTSDLIQNIEHGLNFILPQYENVGHGIVGVISSTFETYAIPGTWGHMTDQLFYDSTLIEGEKTVSHSGKLDDRFAFTNKDSRAEYRNAYVLAAANRALKGENDSLAQKCITVAESIWETEINSDPVFYKSVGVPVNLKEEQFIAATELFLSTKKTKYLQFIEENMDYALANMEQTSWTISRVKEQFKKKTRKKFEKELVHFSDSMKNVFSQNPYGTYLDAFLWGYGWDILWRTYKYYYLTQNYPELFPFDPIINCNEFMLGKHPYNNVSYVSGVGTQIPIPAFGMNRSDYSYIPGGVFSGVNMVEPDFPELLKDHPFIWQQSEYIIHGATPFIFTILAADKYLNNK